VEGAIGISTRISSGVHFTLGVTATKNATEQIITFRRRFGAQDFPDVCLQFAPPNREINRSLRIIPVEDFCSELGQIVCNITLLSLRHINGASERSLCTSYFREGDLTQFSSNFRTKLLEKTSPPLKYSRRIIYLDDLFKLDLRTPRPLSLSLCLHPGDLFSVKSKISSGTDAPIQSPNSRVRLRKYHFHIKRRTDPHKTRIFTPSTRNLFFIWASRRECATYTLVF
jgi:hypothetical protein